MDVADLRVGAELVVEEIEIGVDVMFTGFARSIDHRAPAVDDFARKSPGADVRIVAPYVREARLDADLEPAGEGPAEVADCRSQNDDISECVAAPDLDELRHEA